MRILVLSDIHSNLTALEAVLTAARPFDSVWCLGDLVGYGPEPNQCIELVKTLPNFTCVMGNHDAAVSELRNIDKFNDEAKDAILFTKRAISPGNLEYLKSLPEKIENSYATLVHGSLRNPIWEYLIDPYTALVNFSFFTTPIAFAGHTHLPIIFKLDEKKKDIHRSFLKPGEKISLTNRMILNPGSTGQPRDHDPRASFGILDTDESSWQITRIEYDIPSVQERILSAGLPERESVRLAEGW